MFHLVLIVLNSIFLILTNKYFYLLFLEFGANIYIYFTIGIINNKAILPNDPMKLEDNFKFFYC